MPYTTLELMRAVNTNIAEDAEVTGYINAGDMLVAKCCIDKDYSDNEVETIATWLACHFFHIAEPETSSEGVRGVTESKMNKVDLFLSQTRYGQMAMTLDYEGGLAALNKQVSQGGKPKITVSYLGTDWWE